jgi:SAM-dependent methyltransferase
VKKIRPEGYIIMEEKIEILSVDLLARHSALAQRLKRLAGELGIELGWHYLLDLVWILAQIGPVRGKRILDAGAGTGLIQWYLAQEGAQVISVDRVSRANLSMRFRAHYRVQGMRPEDLIRARKIVRSNIHSASGIRAKSVRTVRGVGGIVNAAIPTKPAGIVVIYNQDLDHLDLVADNSLDGVVSVSALEHNDPEKLPQVLDELVRTLKPGAALLATLGSARDRDWLHEPSKGWCYTEPTLRQLFRLPADTPSNYEDYDRLFEELTHSEALRLGLARFYFQSGDNGMPWGVWSPMYQPVGVVKVKAAG